MDHEIEITQCEAHQIHGFYGSNDAGLWERCLNLVCDARVSDAIALRAIRVIDHITGETSDIESEGGIAEVRNVCRTYQPQAE